MSDSRKPPSTGGGSNGFTVGKSQQVALYAQQQVYTTCTSVTDTLVTITGYLMSN